MQSWFRVSAAGVLAFTALAFAAGAGGAVPSPAGFGRAAGGVGASPAGAEPAQAPESGRQVAANSCLRDNVFAPASVVQSVPDGVGDWLVWIEDRNGELWSCNADSAGRVYLNVAIVGDLLDGRGSEFVAAQSAAVSPIGVGTGEAQALDLCLGVAGLTQGVEAIKAIPDGMGDTLVWLRMADGQLWMCDASADRQLFIFEPVGAPNEAVEDALTLPADAPAI